MRPQPRHGAHGGLEVLRGDGARGLGLGDIDRLRQRLFLGQRVQLRIGRAGIFAIVPFLLDADDVGRALVTREQVIAVLGVEEFSQRLDAADNEQKIVLTFESEHRIDQIVPRALLAELDFQAVGEEREEVRGNARPCRVIPIFSNFVLRERLLLLSTASALLLDCLLQPPA